MPEILYICITNLPHYHKNHQSMSSLHAGNGSRFAEMQPSGKVSWGVNWQKISLSLQPSQPWAGNAVSTLLPFSPSWCSDRYDLRQEPSLVDRTNRPLPPPRQGEQHQISQDGREVYHICDARYTRMRNLSTTR